MAKLILNIYGIPFDLPLYPGKLRTSLVNLENDLQRLISKISPGDEIKICLIPSAFLDERILVESKAGFGFKKKYLLKRQDVREIINKNIKSYAKDKGIEFHIPILSLNETKKINEKTS